MLLTFLILFSKIYMNGIDDSSSYFLEKNYKNFYDVNNEDFSSYKNIDLSVKPEHYSNYGKKTKSV